MEFALIVPLFVLLLFGLVDFGLVFGGFITLRNGVNAGARAASVDYVDPLCATATNPMVCTIENRIGAKLPGVVPGTLQVAIAFPNGSEPNDPVMVCAEAEVTSATGITSPFLSGKYIHAVSELRLEQAPSYGATSGGYTCS